MENDIRLISGIIKQAEFDAEEIMKKAEETVRQKNSTLDDSIEKIRRETDKKIEAKLGELQKRADSAIESELRRQKLRMREKVNNEVHDVFTAKMETLVKTDEYRNFLIKLIAEGAIAVSDELVYVSCSFREKITEDMLNEAEKFIKIETGKDISLKLSESGPLTGQGVIVESSNGRIAYNNQIETRLRRFSEDIKMIIINGLTKG